MNTIQRPTPTYFQGSGLCTAQGGNVDAHLRTLKNPNAPQMLADCINDEAIEFPYFAIAGKSEQQAEHLRLTIDNAITEALEHAQLSPADISKLGIYIGSTSFDIGCAEERIDDSDQSDDSLARHTPPFTNIGAYIQQRFAIDGPVYSFNTACTASANALMYAAEAIHSGEIEQALVIGIELFNRTTALGFQGLELISQSGLGMRPFCADRDGLILGEGCGALIISGEKPAAENAFSFIAGANQTDTFSITSCNPDGSTIASVINEAIERAQITSNDIHWVKTHGTASLSNDDAEAAGLAQVFTKVPPVTALKPFLGHTLGACGINELVLFYRAINAGIAPVAPSHYDINRDFPLRFIAPQAPSPTGYYLLNYFGFGGNNSSLIIGNNNV